MFITRVTLSHGFKKIYIKNEQMISNSVSALWTLNPGAAACAALFEYMQFVHVLET